MPAVLKIILILPTPLFLWEKSEPPPFFAKVSKNQLLPLFTGGRGSSYVKSVFIFQDIKTILKIKFFCHLTDLKMRWE